MHEGAVDQHRVAGRHPQVATRHPGPEGVGLDANG